MAGRAAGEQPAVGGDAGFLAAALRHAPVWVVIIESALAAGERVSALMMQPWAGRRRLPEGDALLLHAHAIYKSETCPRCGRHVKECHDPELAHAWSIDEDMCYATAEVERWRRDSAEHVAPGTAPVLMRAGEARSVSRQAELVAALSGTSGDPTS